MMSDHNFPDIIAAKRDGNTLSEEQIRHFVTSVVEQEIDQVQIGALLMAIRIKGMTLEESRHFTSAIITSGKSFSWPDSWNGLVVDKHSTGGVGDKVSLPLAPALAACGCKVPMVSGRGLGFTGGTLDKLESIPNFNVSLPMSKVHEALDTVGCCIVGQSPEIAPADKVLYQCRDVTATVDSIPLITSSIIGKKAAESLSSLVLDTKFGRASFMKTFDEAKRLAESMVAVGENIGIKTRALLTRMDHPIGFMVGNSLEIIESLQCLRGQNCSQLQELVCLLGGNLLQLTGKSNSLDDGAASIKEVLENGSALKKFKEMLVIQGVSNVVAEKLCDTMDGWKEVLPIAKFQTKLFAQKTGYVVDIDALAVAKVVSRLGAGRQKSGEPIDHSVGVELLTHFGKYITLGDPWIIVYHAQESMDSNLKLELISSLKIDFEAPKKEDIVKEII